MKLIFSFLFSAIVSLAVGQGKGSLIGAWESKGPEQNQTKVITYVPGFFSVAIYNFADKKFIGTYGGKLVIANGELTETIEYDTQKPENVGQSRKVNFKRDKKELTLTGATEGKFTQLDDGTPGKLMGAWLITGRYRDNEIRRSTPGARRTMKILSGTRFQWIAYNVETKEFFGTGGGTYTTVNGKYTENIDFFSRDETRVGASLTFDFSLPEGEWRHQGKSSKGDPLDEIWTQREKIGI
ncbi:MAG TPA: membrane or secreted protein [Cyclobacteriaceae bacterium]|nr:membrane or secreted protein [Cyclobacteriaceae bacterium]